MAPRPAKPTLPKAEQQPSLPKDQGIKKKRSQPSSRKSARLENIERRQDRRRDTDPEPQHLPFPASNTNTPGDENPSVPRKDEDRKRRRRQESENTRSSAPPQSARKRRRTSIASSVVGDIPSQEAAIDPVDYWRRTGHWPGEYFHQDDQTRKDFNQNFVEDSWYGEYWVPETKMNNLLARQRSSSSSRGRESQTNAATPGDKKPSAVGGASYQDSRYLTLLAEKGSFMSKSALGITDTSKSLCQTMFEKEQTVPQDSLFRDDRFDQSCEKIQNRNEARVVQDIARLIVPSAETLATCGAKHLEILIESVNEGWNNSIPFTNTRPQPDYSVGFRREAFTEDQRKRLKPFVGDLRDTSFFMATHYMYFPFLTCEVKCAAGDLDTADRQNAHSTTIAVRGIVELFRLVHREKELHREILAFSISHDHETVRIYGHYPVIDGNETTFYRHPIRRFIITDRDGRDKWAAYKFTMNVYDIWMPTYFRGICSAIDQLPLDLDFEVPR